MFLSIALVLLAGSQPAFADPEPSCFLDYPGVVPTSGASDVPVDTLIRVHVQGQICTQEPLVLTLTEAGKELAPVEVTLDLELGWIEFPERELKPDTFYSASFGHPDGSFTTEFSTGGARAEPPVAPNLVVRDAIVRTSNQGSPQARVQAEVQAYSGDSSGNSTLIFITPDDRELEFQSPDGRVDRSLTWVEDSAPDEACVSAITVSPSGEESAATQACAPVQALAAESVDISNGGCNCSSSGRAGWMILALIPALFIRRKHS